MIDKVILTVNDAEFSLLDTQPTIPINRDARLTIEVQGSEPQYGVDIKCFLVYPPPPTYTGCGACGSLRVPNGQRHGFLVEADTYKEGEGRLEFVINDFVGTVIRVAAVMQRYLYNTV